MLSNAALRPAKATQAFDAGLTRLTEPEDCSQGDQQRP